MRLLKAKDCVDGEKYEFYRFRYIHVFIQEVCIKQLSWSDIVGMKTDNSLIQGVQLRMETCKIILVK